MIAREALVPFLAGAVTISYLVAALFFLKFWRRTRDGLFAAFSVAFALLAANQAVPVLFGIPDEALGGVYLLKAAGFLVIILAILRKNLREG